MAVVDVLEGRGRALGAGFTVRRTLPQVRRRQLGPFVFLDEMGPATLSGDQALDVRPHPHIGLATVTYLFHGAIQHRDTLGTVSRIVPGDVNLMTAGRGIVHSERTPDDLRAGAHHLHGLQAWLALPRTHEDGDPAFDHVAAAALPTFGDAGVRVRLVIGDAFGLRSPVPVASPTLYAEVQLDPGAALALPGDHEERGVYVISGAARLSGQEVGAGRLAVLAPGEITARATGEGAHLMLIGGAPLDGRRLIRWNFVASTQERIDRAEQDWREACASGFVGRFRLPPGEREFIPLPGAPPPGPPPCTDAQPTT